MVGISNILTINQATVPDFTNPLGLLVHCHDRIEKQLSSLERACDILMAGDTASLRLAFGAIDVARAHFAFAGIKHTEDEEVSLFPRLRERGGSAGHDALAAMAELTAQHRTAEKLHARFDQLVDRLPRDGSADETFLDHFGEVVAELTTLHRPHMLLENNLVFPVAARVLPAAEIHALGEEMRERRRDILLKLKTS